MHTINKTTDYSKFDLLEVNRDVNLRKPEAKKLYRSMKEHGYLPSFPLMVRKNGHGKYKVIDGQHRLTIAIDLGLPVYYSIDNSKVDVAELNDTQSTWTLKDHIARWQKDGKPNYQEIIDFTSRYEGVTLGIAAAMLGGTMTSSNVYNSIKGGYYKIKTRDIAHSVAQCFSVFKGYGKISNNSGLLGAIFACHFVDYFDVDELISKVEQNPGMVMNYGGRDEFLDMIQDIYNFKRRAKVPLSFDAKRAAEQRNAISRNP